MTECNIDLTNFTNKPRRNEFFVKYLFNHIFYNYHNKFKWYYDKFTTIEGIISQLKKSDSFEYLQEITLNDIIVWELRTHHCEYDELQYIRGKYGLE